MSEWAARVFWSEVSVQEAVGGFAVALDGRLVKTPAKQPLVLPTEALARRVVAEWQTQTDTIDPRIMPYTRFANVAIDKVSQRMDEVREHIVEYAGSDLLSYRADRPAELVRRQVERWDPLLDWLSVETGATLTSAPGVMPIAQPPKSLSTLASLIADFDAFALAGFSELVSLSGSFVLAFAVVRGRLTPSEAWVLSRLDEDFQIEEWGDDEEAAALAAAKKADFERAAGFLDTLN